MRLFLTFFSGCIMFFGYAQNTATIPFSDSPITIDGNLNESVWQQLPEYTGFYNHLPTDEGLAENQTSVKLFHNGEYLYISAIYKDSTLKTQISSLKRDNSIGFSDAFVLILDTQNQRQNAYYFAVNAGNAQVDGLIERVGDGDSYGINTSWNVVWKTNTSTAGNLKKYEMEIPLKALNYNKNNPVFGIQFYVRDIKNNSWTIFKNVKRNYRLFDLRFTEAFEVENLPDISASRFAVTPSVTVNHQNDVVNDTETTTVKPSLDVQYNLNSSLKLDATVNPDFSQIDVDQQVTNLTRFAVFFPERRNFFLENSDLFSNLGTDEVNPFYSRQIGAGTDIQFGLKLSGNISPKTRLGVLNVQTEEEGAVASQNYSALVAEHQLSKNFTATGFLINRQETDKFNFIDEYNRVTGVNLNYKSSNNKWTGLVNYAKSFNDGVSKDNGFYNAEIWYNKRGASWNASVKNVGKNYLADAGFIPRLNNYDALNDVVVREGYTQFSTGAVLTKYPENSKTVNSYRYVNFLNDTYWDDDGTVTQSSTFYNTAVFFKDLSAVYFSAYHDYINLKYAFDPLRNGNVLMPDTYQFFRGRLGYNSVTNKKFVYRGYVHHGEYYSGKNSAAFASLTYRLLPFANLEASYEINSLDLNELGNKTFHLARFTGEVFFNNRLNWTTYVQYSTQVDNFNINSRLQWEYKPLSYIYLVVTDNYSDAISRTNWGVAFKMNYRFDF
ncbi:DUF5916 domain-containing protein [Galbibacter sp. EGI 63066]|uniref:DUF5916 domain-containing protein n=1 Tax=Galbibacter sp. EGI 63066 TaxID=2993559 RepID=UPI0022492166|nr:DUF5916 domain-containing protein [Galbibacter sp. EGI 63066]MCX2679736.1 DUF5916 domain-containing protein [Galbibacter sp. EGI 63066]